MKSIQDVLLRLADQASCFVRIHRHRVFHVRAPVDVRGAALEVVMAMESHGLNKSPWLLVTDAALGADRGWHARVERLRADHAKRFEAFVEAGHDMRALALPEGEGATLASLHGPVGAFGAMVRAYRHSLPAFLEGLVVVLAPTQVELTPEWARELSALVRSDELTDIRWVLVDDGEGDPLGAPELAGLVRVCPCHPDPEQAKQDATAFLASFDAQCGVGEARPADLPPKRPSEKRRRIDERAPSPEVSVTEAVVASAAHMQQGNRYFATVWQMAAVRRAEAAKRPDLEARCRLTLAGYLRLARKDRFAAGQYAHAVRLTEQARLAGEQGLEPVEVSARLALALSWWGAQRHADALVEFGRAGELAEETGQMAPAISAWRHAGQLARELELDNECVRAWVRAVKLGVEHPDAGRLGGTDEVRRLLTEVCSTAELNEQTTAEVLALGELRAPEDAETSDADAGPEAAR